MVRKQIYIDEHLNENLKKVALMKKTSEAELVREALVDYFSRVREEGPENPLHELIAFCDKGRVDGSEDHDRYLYGADSDE